MLGPLLQRNQQLRPWVNGLTTLVFLAAALAQGLHLWREQTGRFDAHWTRDKELLFWRQRQDSLLRYPVSVLLAVIVGTAVHLALLLAALGLALSDLSAQPLLLVIGALLLPAQLVGNDVGVWLLRPRTLSSITILNTGVIGNAMFFPWSSLKIYELDRPQRSIRLSTSPTAYEEVVAMRPPDDATFERALALVSKHLSERSPLQREQHASAHRRGSLLLLSLLLLSLLLLEGFAAWGALIFWGFAWNSLLLRTINRLLGFNPLEGARQSLLLRDESQRAQAEPWPHERPRE